MTAPRKPFGYFWEIVHDQSGEVVNSGFSQKPMKPLANSGIAGFRRRVTELDYFVGDDMKETFDLVTENAGELVEMLAQVTAALENSVLHHGQPMPLADRNSRARLVEQAKTLLEKLEQ